MKTRILFPIAFLLAILTGCKNETAPAPAPAPAPAAPAKEAPKQEVEKQCYAYEGKGTKITAELLFNNNEVSGTLDYAIAEKDKNSGTVSGSIANDILILDYSFEAEGTTSVRQVAFKKVGGQLIEGYGDMNEDGTRFKDVSQLKFTSTMPLSKIDCKE